MKQKDNVIEAFKNNNNFATLSQLYMLTDVSKWETKTPFASIRRILQTNKEFYKITAGLWGLTEKKHEIEKKLNLINNECQFSHSYYQGLIVSIGNLRGFQTFIPSQDKNKYFMDTRLGDLATLDSLYSFTYDELTQKAKFSDCIWFNERKMPHAFYEVEHSTNIKNSINRFYELQDFRAKFFIVAHKNRYREFQNIISNSIYEKIKDIVYFADYESIAKQYEKESVKYEMGI
ncbi:hypothetical protein ACJMBT_001069 [Campylobacter lari]|uniref:Uncharacterized protein n=1 Tax=Campylobacter armoricus TaxID=2505970 RepID=A0A7L5I8B2_9BACT|nr:MULTISPECIES: hypothetical protein [Campylobacter]EAH6292153.1 hypothetical protein [Campylobacter lari]EAI6155022.1 hypothetical protein [Campylobacter lari]EAI7870267.1 hypothetical protein [Campylobacter lari]EAI8653330.1 hypothetical protein [Campylobacter lari]EAJ5702545.1 hypothetical protein [Campylobacter lari]